jgi:hypothetical protein
MSVQPWKAIFYIFETIPTSNISTQYLFLNILKDGITINGYNRFYNTFVQLSLKHYLDIRSIHFFGE